VAASVFMGGGIAALHYTAMSAMRLPAMCRYSPALVTLSVVLAVAFSLISYGCVSFSRRAHRKEVAEGCKCSADGRGNLRHALHRYGGCQFYAFCPGRLLSHAVSISFLGTVGIAIVTLMVLGITILTAWWIVFRSREPFSMSCSSKRRKLSPC